MTKIVLQPQTSDIKSASGLVQRMRHRLRQLAENWQSRAVLARFERLDERLLRDVCLDRSDIEWAKQLPLTVHCERALFARAGHR